MHEPISHRGLQIKRNTNGFAVVQVHYSADPAKDPHTPEGKYWLQQAKLGMPEASWRKEYEIDWFARSGQLVYPWFSRDVHVIEPFVIPDDWTIYMAIDPGLRNPTAALWAAVDPEDTVYFFDEYYMAEKVIKEHCEALKLKERGRKIYKRFIDPSSCGRNMTQKRSNREEYSSYGIHCQPANNSLELGIDKVSGYLAPQRDTGKPGAYFFSALVNTLDEIINYRWEEMDAGAVFKSNLSEKPMKKKDHLMDCMRYILVSEPRYIKEITLPPQKPHNVWDDMTTGYW